MLKLHNYLNELKTGNLTTKQQNLFISILEKLQENKEKESRRTILFTFAQLKIMAGFKYRGNKRFQKYLEDLLDKILSSKHKIELEKGKKTVFNIFSKMEIDEVSNTLTITVNSDYEHFLFDIDECYSQISIDEYILLKNNYSKILYRIAKQWETVGITEIDMNKFRELLEIPSKYEINHITNKILNPVKEELAQFFQGFNYKKIKTGKKITSITFTWQRVERNKKNSQKFKKKAEIGIIKIKPSLGEDDLRKYEAEKLKLVDMLEHNLANNTLNAENIIRKNITREEYDRIYKEYLKDNKIIHNKFIRLAFEKSNESKFIIK